MILYKEAKSTTRHYLFLTNKVPVNELKCANKREQICEDIKGTFQKVNCSYNALK